MIQFVNGNLMSYGITTVNDTKNGALYHKMKICNSNKLLQYVQQNNSKCGNRGRDCKIVCNSEEVVPIQRELLRITNQEKWLLQYGEQLAEHSDLNLQSAMSLFTTEDAKHRTHVEIRCHESGTDNAHVYIVAFPFNGMIAPIPEDPRYRIYNAMIVSSVKPFIFDNRRYRKVLYLVIEPNKNLFNPDHKYHTDCIDIVFKSYALFYPNRLPDGTFDKTVSHTKCETMTLAINDAHGGHMVSWEFDTADHIIDMSGNDTPLWKIFKYERKNPTNGGNYRSQDNSNHGYHKPNRNNRNQPYQEENGIRITTNRHGIRKEVQIKTFPEKRRPYNNYIPNASADADLDAMMRNSGMYDNDRFGGKNGRGNGKRSRRK